ncbi:uclacyanin 1 [Helianthus annuus]|nr:uclacyanin 1 [Helianthus annuus]
MTNIIQTHTFLKITLFFQEYKIMAKVSIMRVLIGLAAMVMLLQVVVATDYTVGSPSGGWDTTTDLGSWSSSQTFTVGDNLDFQFGPTHDVVEVTKDNYDSCGTGNAISTTTTSPARIALTSAGTRYFICGRSNHCSLGMKVQVNVVAASTPTTPSPPQTTTPSSPTPPEAGPTSPSPPPPATGTNVEPPSSAISLKMTAGTMLGLGFLVMLL